MKAIKRTFLYRTRRALVAQAGFTLIELLVATGILAMMAGIAIPVVTKYIGSSEQKAATAETANVQTAVDAMMVDNELTDLGTCTVLATDEDDMTRFPCPALPLNPDYIRQATTSNCFDVDNSGLVTLGTCW